MLDHHPRIAFNLESDFLVRHISDDGEYPSVESYRARLRDDRVFRHSLFHIDERLDFLGLINDFLDQKRRRDQKAIVGATVHVDFRKLNWIWTNAKYIHIVRDGRDVASSVLRMGWAGNLYVAGDTWLRAEHEWDVLRNLLPDGSWLDVRYEELIAKPRCELERVCKFIGVTFDERMFEYASSTNYELPDVKLNYQWKTRMRREDVQLLEAKLGNQLLSRGYELSSYPRIVISPLRHRFLYLHSKLAAFLRRFKRFGITLTVQEAVSRRLGFRALHDNATRKINVIIDGRLK
jgi:hypothetical protein